MLVTPSCPPLSPLSHTSVSDMMGGLSQTQVLTSLMCMLRNRIFIRFSYFQHDEADNLQDASHSPPSNAGSHTSTREGAARCLHVTLPAAMGTMANSTALPPSPCAWARDCSPPDTVLAEKQYQAWRQTASASHSASSGGQALATGFPLTLTPLRAGTGQPKSMKYRHPSRLLQHAEQALERSELSAQHHFFSLLS